MKDLAEMNALDIYLSNVTVHEYEELKPQIGRSNVLITPLLSWDIFSESLHKRVLNTRKKIELKQVQDFAAKYHWRNNIELLFSENDYEALIITDKSQQILWVNDGFTSMTGYPKEFAIQKTPRFLQGEKTSAIVKNRIKKKIALEKPFKEVIINHRKDNSTYKCEVKIYPLYNENTTHYIAFERQVV